MRSMVNALLVAALGLACDHGVRDPAADPAANEAHRYAAGAKAAGAKASRPLEASGEFASERAPLGQDGPEAAFSLDEPGETEPLRVEPLDPDQDPPTYVTRGGQQGPERLVFLHGMCGHGLGYAQSIQFAATQRGTLVAPQGDTRCGKGPWSSYSPDVEPLDSRIVAAFRALGHPEPSDITVIGYSLGASRAEALVRKYPERYTRLISIGAPRAPSAKGLEQLKAAVMMAGERDRQDLMKAGVRSLTLAGVPVTFQEIPEATHGSMGPTPEATMAEALEWLWDHSRE